MTAPLMVSFKLWDRQKYIHCPVIYMLVWKMMHLVQVSDYKCKTILFTFSCLSIFLNSFPKPPEPIYSGIPWVQRADDIFKPLLPMPVPSSSFSLSQAGRGMYLPSKSPFAPWVYLPDTKLLTPWLTLLNSPEMGSTALKLSTLYYPAIPSQASQKWGILTIGAVCKSSVKSFLRDVQQSLPTFLPNCFRIIKGVKHIKSF